MSLSKEEKLRAINTKRLQRIILKHDKLKGCYGNPYYPEVPAAYLSKMTPKIEKYIQNADLDQIAFVGLKHFKNYNLNSKNPYVQYEYKNAISPLMWAIKNQYSHFVDEMLEHGANINYSMNTDTSEVPEKIGPLYTSLDVKNEQFIAHLIERGAKYDEKMITELKYSGLYPGDKSDMREDIEPIDDDRRDEDEMVSHGNFSWFGSSDGDELSE